MHFYIKYDKIYQKGKITMQRINFKLEKEQKTIINEKNINCIINNKTTFIINKLFYIIFLGD